MRRRMPGSSDRATADQAIGLAEELQQPLAAASNYIGVVRLLLAGKADESLPRALKSLEQAEQQILRAGEIARNIRVALTSH